MERAVFRPIQSLLADYENRALHELAAAFRSAFPGADATALHAIASLMVLIEVWSCENRYRECCMVLCALLCSNAHLLLSACLNCHHDPERQEGTISSGWHRMAGCYLLHSADSLVPSLPVGTFSEMLLRVRSCMRLPRRMVTYLAKSQITSSTHTF